MPCLRCLCCLLLFPVDCCVSSFYNREKKLNFGPFGLCTIRCLFQNGDSRFGHFWDSCQGTGLINKPNIR